MFKSDPFEDLSLNLLAASKAQPPVHTPPALTPGAQGWALLPSPTQSSTSAQSPVGHPPTLPPVPARSQPQESVRRSPNPFSTSAASANPFAERTAAAGNPFRAAPPRADAAPWFSEEEPAASRPAPPLNPSSPPAGFEDPPALRGWPAGRTSHPRGWVTFEEEEDFAVRGKSRSPCPDLLGGQPGSCPGPSGTFDSGWGGGTSVPSCAVPSRRPPPPPVPGPSAGPAPPGAPPTAWAPQGAPTLDFTER